MKLLAGTDRRLHAALPHTFTDDALGTFARAQILVQGLTNCLSCLEEQGDPVNKLPLNPKLPLIKMRVVQHVGTMNPDHQGKGNGRHGASYEGHHLSVSSCPDAWRKIADLGNAPTWTLTPSGPQPGVFLDVRSLTAAAYRHARRHIIAWGMADGLVTEELRWRAYEKDENGEWRYTLHVTAQEALDEVGSNDSEGALDLPEDFDLNAELRTFDLVAFTDHRALTDRLNELLPDGPDGEAKVMWSTEVIGGPALKAATGMLDEGFQALAVAWAQHESRAAGGQEIDGIWWPDLLDVYAYSAPRGLIFRERVPAWHARQIP